MPTNSVSHTEFVAYPIPGLARIPRDSLVPNVISKTMCLDFTTSPHLEICFEEKTILKRNKTRTKRDINHSDTDVSMEHSNGRCMDDRIININRHNTKTLITSHGFRKSLRMSA
jgi:hypothetical protein